MVSTARARMASLCCRPGGVGQDAESYAIGIMSQEVGMAESEEPEKEDRLPSLDISNGQIRYFGLLQSC